MSLRHTLQTILMCSMFTACGGEDESGSESESESEGEGEGEAEAEAEGEDCVNLPFVGSCSFGNPATTCQEIEVGSQVALDEEQADCGTTGGNWAVGVCTSIPAIAGGCRHTAACRIETEWCSAVSCNTPTLIKQATMTCKAAGGMWVKP
jgi:hypothetical protein